MDRHFETFGAGTARGYRIDFGETTSQPKCSTRATLACGVFQLGRQTAGPAAFCGAPLGDGRNFMASSVRGFGDRVSANKSETKSRIAGQDCVVQDVG